MRALGTVASILFAAVPLFAQAGPEVKAILPVVGSTAGGFGSNFKTEVQLHNRGSETIHGMVVFHPQGSPAGAGDPVATYELAPRQTLHFEDLVASLGTSGLGSLDVIPIEGGLPAVVARAYDDQGELGTSGATIDLLDPRDALTPGIDGVLILPSDLTRFRYNVGVRSLGAGATLRATVYDANGAARFAVERTYAPHSFEQMGVTEFAGGEVAENDSIVVEILAGAALVYGTTTDNVSNDPSLQIAARVER